jgi:coenzyme F420-0:L-glutamate ligase/coenzyme F420-1:gamma-L-glutamate ligase
MALADELAAAADLVKGKLAGRPVAVLRGLAELVGPQPDEVSGAAAILRTGREDLFSHGSREAVLAALCRALGVPEAYPDLVGVDAEAAANALLARGDIPAEPAALVRRLLDVAQRLGAGDATETSGPPG